MSATINGQSVSAAAADAVRASRAMIGSRPAMFPHTVSPLYQSIAEQALTAGFAAAAAALGLPFAGAAVVFGGGRAVASPLPAARTREQDVPATRRRAEASVVAEIEHLPERWSDEFRPRANALIRRIEALELDRYAAIALPTMIGKIVDAACELAAIQFQIAIPALTALERFETFVAHNLKGYESESATMLAGPVTERVRAESGLADLAGAAKAVGLPELIVTTPAAEAMTALDRAPLGVFYAAAVADYLREFGFRQDGADLATPSWSERPEIAIARVRELIVSGGDARAEYQAALSAAVKATNVARSVLAEQPGAVRDQFETLLVQARAAKGLLADMDLLVGQRSRVAVRRAFLKLGARLTKLGMLCRADDIFLLTLPEVAAAVVSVPSEAAIGTLRVLLLEREAAQEAAADAEPRVAVVGPVPADARSGALERAIARLFGTVVA